MSEIISIILLLSFIVAGIVLMVYAILFFVSMFLVIRYDYYSKVVYQVEKCGLVHCKYASALRWFHGRKGWKAKFQEMAEFYKWDDETKKKYGWRE